MDCKFTIDNCPDSNGFSTIRMSDASMHGNTESQPVGTIYQIKYATHIVDCVNGTDDRTRSLINTLRGIIDDCESRKGRALAVGTLKSIADRARIAIFTLDK